MLDGLIEKLDTLIILGSGMSGCYLPDEYEVLHDTGRDDLPGHTGKLALLHTNNAATLVSLGRRHMYEGYRPDDVVAIIAAAARLGARRLIITNAAGGLNPRYEAGEIMLIESCLGVMLGSRVAPRSAAGDSRFDPSCERSTSPEAFAVELFGEIEERALQQNVALRRGVYAGVLGPSYETRAEIRMLRRMGADAVGMSTVVEAAAARALGMKAIGLSLITNVLTDTEKIGLDHSHVVEQGKLGEARMRSALDAALEVIAADIA